MPKKGHDDRDRWSYGEGEINTEDSYALASITSTDVRIFNSDRIDPTGLKASI
jgi:hypothetical protein